MPAVASKNIGVSGTASFGTILRAWSKSFFRWSGPMRSGFSPNVDTPRLGQRHMAGSLSISRFTRMRFVRPFFLRLQRWQRMEMLLVGSFASARGLQPFVDVKTGTLVGTVSIFTESLELDSYR